MSSLSSCSDSRAFARLAALNPTATTDVNTIVANTPAERPAQNSSLSNGAAAGTLEERTFVLLKPNAVKNSLVAQISKRLQQRGLVLVTMKLIKPGSELAQKHYAPIEGTPAYQDLALELAPGPAIAMLWSGADAIHAVQTLLGDADPSVALPGTVRGDFDLAIAGSLAEAAESKEEACRLQSLWFEPKELSEASKSAAKKQSSSNPAAGGGRHVVINSPSPHNEVKDLCTGKSAVVHERFYLTTAIFYANGPPHMGHAYEGILADVITRYHRAYGREVYFLTGSDEHGQKIADTAKDQGIEPIELCDQCVMKFKALNERLLISNDSYVRTSSKEHKAAAQRYWKMALEKGDIYLGVYEGWYNVREETFVTESEAALTDYKDSVSGKPLKKMEEQSYFFRLSKYREAIIEWVQKRASVVPEARRNEVLARLRDDLNDLSISRTTFSWGIEVPDDYKHVMYVWFDALTNYISAIGWPDGPLSKFWPANCHLIGKDISWFHCVIWPALLLSMGAPLPSTVLAHGFVHGGDGNKMSKSLGNVVFPSDVLDRHCVDAMRYFMVRDVPFGGDLTFSEDALILRHNSDLCDTFGNLVNRGLKLCEKDFGGVVPDALPEVVLELDTLRKETEAAYASYSLHSAMEIAVSALFKANKYVTDVEPWHLPKGDPKKAAIVRTLLELIYALTHFLQPVLVEGAKQVFEKLATPPVTIASLSANFINLKPGTKTTAGEVLYQKAESAAAVERIEREAVEKKRKAEAAAQKKAAKAAAAAGESQSELSKLDLRVGRILAVVKHPEADSLYIEEIDLGDTKPRQVVSGLVKHMTPDQMQGKLVVCLANIKPEKLRGVESQAMVLCGFPASGSPAELVQPPADCSPGTRVVFEGHDAQPERQLNPKKKVFANLKPNFNISDERIARFDQLPFNTPNGPCRVATIAGGTIG
eukprot:CAMPEP_0119316882 /NCGR_PEP_ID=MMETSP1333-20130426/41235_1 /TAXON_ID=418940 /ORGANISM="Scyphosphaera apsteinii, Strain RCC1455" /LENGTH=934 /DNA_ID=CAMNT_0007322657 /DNA_START=1 /DNA_END=2805 /DNA_ORIENTATION=-